MSVYFDNAATTYPKPEQVYSFMDQFYRQHGGNAGRGQYHLAAEASRLQAETRSLLKRVLHCENKDVIFTPSATLAMNMVLLGTVTRRSMTVYCTPFEHNAVTRTLHHLEQTMGTVVRVLPLTNDYTYDLTAAEEHFRLAPPDVLVMSHASNVCGLIAPVEALASLAKRWDAVTVLDLAQTAGLVPLDLGLECYDYAIFAGHKTLYGPIGIGGFVKKPSLSPVPVLFGGTGIESALQEMPKTIPSRYEMGSQNIHAIAGLHAALSWFLSQADTIRAQEEQNHRRLVELLGQYPVLKIVGPADRSNCIGVVSCVFEDYSSDNIGDVLDGMEVAVRTGLHCAPLAHRTLGTFPAGTVRFSVSCFTNEQDFAQLAQALDELYDNM